MIEGAGPGFDAVACDLLAISQDADLAFHRDDIERLAGEVERG